MLFGAIFVVVFLLLNYIIAGGWLLSFSKQSFWRPIIIQLVGMTLLLSISAFLMMFDLPPTLIFPLVIPIGVLGFLFAFRNVNYRFLIPKISGVKTSWPLVFAPLTLLFLETRSLFASQFSFKIGPDNFGFSSAAAYLCRGGTISSLTDSVQSQLGSTEILDSYIRPVPAGVFSISRISSFTDQAASEFLIGAHRTGAPSLLAAFCESTGPEYLHAIFIGAMGWALFLVAMIIRAFALEKGLNWKLATSIALIVSLNVNVLSVTLEGGFGQLLTLPFFFICAAWISRNFFDFEIWVVFLAMLFATATATYLDVLYLAVPFLAVALIVRIIFWRDVKFRFSRITFIAAVLGIIASIPIAPHLYRLIISPISNPTHGGWDQGNFQLLDNTLGLSSRLSKGLSTFLEPRDVWVWIFDISLSLLILYLVYLTLPRLSVVFIPLLGGYLYLTYSIYFSTAEVMNNYRIWKYSEYASVFFALVLIDVANSYKNNWKAFTNWKKTERSKTWATLVVLAVLFFEMTASIIWAIDWKQSSKVTLSEQGATVLRPYMEKYDLEVVCGAYPAEYLIIGDLRYAANNRGTGLVSRSVPERDLVVLAPGQGAEAQECLNQHFKARNYFPVTKLEENNEFQLFKVDEK